MIKEDYEIYCKVFPLWRDTAGEEIKRILLLSPGEEQIALITRMFPRATIISYFIDDYNLNTQLRRPFDLIIALNVFFYSPNPKLWFDNLAGKYRFLWIQDIIHRKRSALPGQHLATDGDQTRFVYRPGYDSHFSGAFDLSIFKDQIMHFMEYSGGIVTGEPARHFVMCMKGTGRKPGVLDAWRNHLVDLVDIPRLRRWQRRIGRYLRKL